MMTSRLVGVDGTLTNSSFRQLRNCLIMDLPLNLEKIHKIFLPKEPGLHSTRSLHRGRHFEDVYKELIEEMNEIIDKATAAGVNKKSSQTYYQKALLDLLNKERVKLEKGTRILNNPPKPKPKS